MKTLTTLLLFGTLCASVTIAEAQVSVGNVYPGKTGYAAFTVSQSGTVTVSGNAGGFYDNGRLLIFYGWILNSETRKVAWLRRAK
jgi:hypothetical protein